MKQILQNLKTGSTNVADVPCPSTSSCQLLIRTTRSLISAGTERMLVDFGKANPIAKARQQPDKVRQVLEKIKTDGLLPTLETVRNKLDQPLPLGYCNVGIVQQAGSGVTGFAVGDRIVSNGKHAEVVSVPVNLCARIPDSVSDESAAFTVIGAIALQGIRLVAPTLGETVVVTGLGLIGLMTVQLLRAQGCRVLGIDMDPEKLALARQFGAETVDLGAGQDSVAIAESFSRGRGVDAVIITAATRSNEPVHQAALMCRKRGRIVLVGVVGLELSRADFYEKELTFQVSCSYGPGRYDPQYEQQGFDYPVGFVRWTEQRNFEAVLDMMADGRLNVEPLISHRFKLEDAKQAYEIVGGAEPSLGILLEYGGTSAGAHDLGTGELFSRTVALNGGTQSFVETDASKLPAADNSEQSSSLTDPVSIGVDVEGSASELGSNAKSTSVASSPTSGSVPASRAAAGSSISGVPSVSFIGSGNYATAVLIPAFKATGAVFRSVVSSGGVSGVHAGKKFGFQETTTDADRVFHDADCDAVVITTRHDSHANYVLKALDAGKAVFVEKPLCLTLDELTQIEHKVRSVATPSESTESSVSPCQLMVGFNRRFAPHVQKMKSLLTGVTGPKAFVMAVNAGFIPRDHWTQDPEVGGGRIVGEACHFIDLLRFLAGVPIVSHSKLSMVSETADSVSLQFGFADGSIGTIHYLANGSKAFPKERLDVFAAGRVLQLDNFRVLRGFGWPGFKTMRLWRQDKGQNACAAAFLNSVGQGGLPPIPIDEILEVTRVSIELSR